MYFLIGVYFVFCILLCENEQIFDYFLEIEFFKIMLKEFILKDVFIYEKGVVENLYQLLLSVDLFVNDVLIFSYIDGIMIKLLVNEN